jgi:hypothetical protein
MGNAVQLEVLRCARGFIINLSDEENIMADTYQTPDTQPPYPQAPSTPPAPPLWKPPTDKQEWTVTEDVNSAPAWIDKSWIGAGPSIKVPVGDYPFGSPYTTEKAEVGDEVQYLPPSATSGGHFIVVKNADARVVERAAKPAQASAASLEDLIKTGHVTADELSAGEKLQVAVRSPRFRPLLSGEVPPPDAPKLEVKAATE